MTPHQRSRASVLTLTPLQQLSDRPTAAGGYEGRFHGSGAGALRPIYILVESIIAASSSRVANLSYSWHHACILPMPEAKTMQIFGEQRDLGEFWREVGIMSGDALFRRSPKDRRHAQGTFLIAMLLTIVHADKHGRNP